MTAYTLISSISAGGGVSSTYLNSIRTNQIHFSELLSWSPSVTQSVSVTRTVNEGWYGMAGKRVFAQCKLTCSSAGTSGQPIRLSLPVTAAASGITEMAIGSGMVYDAGTNYYNGVALLQSTTTCGIRANATTADIGAGGGVYTFALANLDFITVSIQYEAA